MLGTIVNSIAIIVGSLIGIIFSKKISAEISDVISSAAGVITLIIGFQMAFQMQNIIYIAISLILGGILGAWWDIDGKILSIGRFLEHHFGKKNISEGNESKFAYAFLNASVLFCVGAMAIVGSFKAGTEGDYTMLYTKSVLDGFMSLVFSAAMGIGTAFSALTIFVYQGLLTLGSAFIKPWVSPQMIAELTGIGGAFVIMIGINILDLKKLKTANYLPGLIVLVFFVLADPFLQKIAAFLV
ncbi:MAG TPA: DUF554 domain-containing protein [Treponemataceae bacterium]|nr:DUF554 domain-containing protein [Treponemataceae bacterium]